MLNNKLETKLDEAYCPPAFNPCGETEQSILRRGYLLAKMITSFRKNMTDQEKEAVDYFITASYSPENPPNGFTAETWAMVEKISEGSN